MPRFVRPYNCPKDGSIALLVSDVDAQPDEDGVVHVAGTCAHGHHVEQRLPTGMLSVSGAPAYEEAATKLAARDHKFGSPGDPAPVSRYNVAVKNAPVIPDEKLLSRVHIDGGSAAKAPEPPEEFAVKDG